MYENCHLVQPCHVIGHRVDVTLTKRTSGHVTFSLSINCKTFQNIKLVTKPRDSENMLINIYGHKVKYLVHYIQYIICNL